MLSTSAALVSQSVCCLDSVFLWSSRCVVLLGRCVVLLGALCLLQSNAQLQNFSLPLCTRVGTSIDFQVRGWESEASRPVGDLY